MPTSKQLNVRDFVKEVKHAIDLYHVCTVTRRYIQETFFDEITHGTMYFPLPGDPEPSNSFTDFQRCMKQNGLMIVNHQRCDGFDRHIDIIAEEA